MTVALVDYGAGNLTSVRKGLQAVGAVVEVVTSPEQLDKVAALVIPGVGNFRSGLVLTTDWRRAILDAMAAGTPLLGICLGMQWLFDGSEEAPEVPGLGIFPGRCTRITVERPLKVPHVGWNSLSVTSSAGILSGVEQTAYVYFTHTFAAPVTSDCTASATHGIPFAAAAERGRVAGVQFHPEKSGDTGLKILRNFVEMAGG